MEPTAEVKRYKARCAAAWSREAMWQTLYQEAYRYGLPSRDQYTSNQEGAKKGERVFDSTAVHGVTRFAGRLMDGLMPPDTQWAELKAGPLVPEAMRGQFNQILFPITQTIFAVLMSGSFSLAAHEMCLDLAAGTGAMLILPGDDEDPVRFIAMPQAQVALEEGPWGGTSGIFRRPVVKASNLLRQWPDATLSTEQRKQVEADNAHSTDITLEEGTTWDSKEKRWKYWVLWGDDMIVDRKGTRTCPWITPRWMKVPGETKGRGPLLLAMPDIKTINKVVEMTLLNAALALAGVYTVAEDTVVNTQTLRIVPGAFIPVRRNGGSNGPSIMPLKQDRVFDVASFVLEDMRMNIKKFLLDNQLPPDAGPVRSATEIVQRMKELQQDAGSAFGRLVAECIVPIIRRVAEILMDKGIIKVKGADKISIDQLIVKVQVLSPLSKQQGLAEVEAVANSAAVLKGLGGDALVALGLNVEKLARYIPEQLGVKSNFIRTTEEVQQMQKAAAAAMQQQGGIDPMAARGAMTPPPGAAPLPMAA